MVLMLGTSVSRLAFIAVVALALLVVTPVGVAAQDPCEDPGNLTFNCQFDTFTAAPGGEVPTGWWPFVISGHPAFDSATDTPKLPSLRVWSDGEAFVAGIYQEVSGVEIGATYEVFVGWAVFQSNGSEMGRAIGIDPGGGTDPTSPAVVWSTEVWEKKRSNPELRVRAVAQADKITVFVRANNPHSSGADQAFFDAVSLIRDVSVPVEAPVAVESTSTLVPLPTDTPVVAIVEPTSTPVPTATVPPTETATSPPTHTATSTTTPTPTVPPDTPTPTATRRSPEVWVLATAAVMIETPNAITSSPEVANVTIGLAGPVPMVAGGAVVMIGLAVGVWRAGRHRRGVR